MAIRVRSRVERILRRPATRQQPERQEQKAIVRLLQSLGATVYVLGTTRPAGGYMGTCQTPGIPDLYAFLPAGGALWVEVKATGGRLSPAQLAFRELCASRGVHYVTGGVDSVAAWLRVGWSA